MKPTPMRDSSRDYRTGWIRRNEWFERQYRPAAGHARQSAGHLGAETVVGRDFAAPEMPEVARARELMAATGTTEPGIFRARDIMTSLPASGAAPGYWAGPSSRWRAQPGMTTPRGSTYHRAGLLGAYEKRGKIRKALANLHAFKPAARRFLTDALGDPEVRLDAVELLSSPDPHEAVARQANRDAVETAHPRGGRIVFKSYGQEIAGRIHAAERAAADEMTNPSVEMTMAVLESENPKKAAEAYLSLTMAEAFAPGTLNFLDEQDDESLAGIPGMGFLGANFFKRAAKKMTEGTAGKVTGWLMGPGTKQAIRNYSKGAPIGKTIAGVVDPIGTEMYRKYYAEPKEAAREARKKMEAEQAAVQAAYQQELESAYGLDAPASAPATGPAYVPPGGVDYSSVPAEPGGSVSAEMAAASGPPPAAEEEGSALPIVAALAAGGLAIYSMT